MDTRGEEASGAGQGQWETLESGVSSSLVATIRTFGSTVKSANALLPGFGVAALLLGSAVVVAAVQVGVAVGMVVLAVFLAAVAIYLRGGSFADALVTLVLGLLAAFAVPWTGPKLLAFLLSWVGFFTFFLLAISLRLASAEEAALTQTALRIDREADVGLTRKALASAIRKPPASGIALENMYEAAHLLACRGWRIDDIERSMPAVVILSASTGSDHMAITEFVADTEELMRGSGVEGDELREAMYQAISGARTQPTLFLAAFKEAKQVAFSDGISWADTVLAVQRGLNLQLQPGQILPYVRQTTTAQ
jgi:hypothetical protein